MAADYHTYNLMYGFCASVCGSAFIHRLRDVIRDPRNRVAWFVALQFLFVAMAFVFATPTVYQWLGRSTGIVNVATLLVYTSILACSAHFQAALLTLSRPPQIAVPQIRRRFVVYAVLIAVLVGLFAAGDVEDTERPIDFDSAYAAEPFITQFLALYYAGFGAVMGSAGLLGWRYAKVAGRAWLVRGLRLIAIGAGFALVYCAAKVIAVAGVLAGWHTDQLSTRWAPISASIGALIIAAGITMPALEPRLEPIAVALYRRRALRDLQPLWEALYQASPSIALDPPQATWKGRWDLRDLRHRLYRRVIEIQDGLVALHDHLDPAVAVTAKRLGEAAGLTGRRLAATQEAAMVTAALQAKRDNRLFPEPARALTADHAGDNLSATIGWLVFVARAYEHSPVVRDTISQTAGHSMTAPPSPSSEGL